MNIEVTTGVYWDTKSKQQSPEAYAWMREENFAKMGMSSSDADGLIAPELDKYQRPIRWVIEHDSCVVTITREYVDANSPSWALKGDTIVITSKKQ